MKRPGEDLIRYDWPYAFTYIYFNDPWVMLKQKFGEAWLRRPETPIELMYEREKRFLGAFYNCWGEAILVPEEYQQPIPIPFEFPGGENAYATTKHTIGGGWPIWGQGFHDNRILWMYIAGCCPKELIAETTGTFEVPT